MTHAERIAKLKAELARLERAPKMKPTGAFNVVIRAADGHVAHTFEAPNKRAAILKRNDFYKVLVIKLKQKVSISVQPEYKKA